MISIAIIEDSHKVVQELSGLFGELPDVELKVATDSVGDFLEHVELDSPPMVLLLDIKLYNTISLRHVDKISRLLPVTAILIHSGYASEDFIAQAFQKGIKGYLVKGASPTKLLGAIETVAQGKTYLDPLLSDQIASLLQQSQAPHHQQVEVNGQKLNERESQIAHLLAEGKSYKEVAELAFISINTVRFYVRNIYHKLGVKNKVELAKLLNSP